MATGTISRKAMEQVLTQGGSVLYRGRVITRAQDLPSEAELAQGNPQAEAEVQQRLQQQLADLQAQIAQLQGTQVSGEQASSEQKPAGGRNRKKRDEGDEGDEKDGEEA